MTLLILIAYGISFCCACWAVFLWLALDCARDRIEILNTTIALKDELISIQDKELRFLSRAVQGEQSLRKTAEDLHAGRVVAPPGSGLLPTVDKR